ncbi:hypothetical protein FSP39_022299 [Pinctada imbricata]|uniref:Uncharacterized protein n=1 Tax=Pinctada imbricata TaxID=66713 RepID=A0AA88Y1M0_PINIB|nr:hypothetical protein FSP39_022299 [Pinctada imbricata]
MSEVDYMDNYARNGVLTAHGARMHINNAYKIHALQHDPKRNFNMRIADSPVYRSAQYDESNGTCSIHDEIDHSIKYIDKIVPRDHFFDSKQRMRYHTVKPVGTISGNDYVCRGVLPVRARYKVDESKILPSKRQ